VAARGAQDQRVEQEVARAAEAPEDLSRVLERRKLDAVFRLWADRRGEGGRVERKDLCKALTRCPVGRPGTLPMPRYRELGEDGCMAREDHRRS